MFGSGGTESSLSVSFAKLSALDSDRATEDSLEGGRDDDESSRLRRMPRLRLGGMFVLPIPLKRGSGNVDENSSDRDALGISRSSSEYVEEERLLS